MPQPCSCGLPGLVPTQGLLGQSLLLPPVRCLGNELPCNLALLVEVLLLPPLVQGLHQLIRLPSRLLRLVLRLLFLLS